jgi:hypothetical protein
MTPLVSLGQPLVKTLVKNPLNTLNHPLSPGTFAAFSKGHKTGKAQTPQRK